MSLQALVFCADEKVVRILRRVLSELEIGMELCADAESAIHKLTRGRFEAVIVDCTDLGTASVWALMQDIGGKHVGSVLGWGNMWGSVGAACSAVVLNRLIEGPGGWEAAFVACAVAFLLSGVTALGVDATVPIMKTEEAASADR